MAESSRPTFQAQRQLFHKPGSCGSWNTASAIKLSPTNYPTWSGVIQNLPSDTFVEWKCIKKAGSNVVWQPGANNSFTTPLSGTAGVSGSF